MTEHNKTPINSAAKELNDGKNPKTRVRSHRVGRNRHYHRHRHLQRTDSRSGREVKEEV